MKNMLINNEYPSFVLDLKEKIRNSQYQAMKVVNKQLITLYREIGKAIYNIQLEKGWGKSVIEMLAKDLQNEFPDVKGFSARNIWRMRNFYVEFKDNEFLPPLVAEISWTKNIIIIIKGRIRKFI